MMLLIFLILMCIGVAVRPSVGGWLEILDWFLIITITIIGIVLETKNNKKRGE